MSKDLALTLYFNWKICRGNQQVNKGYQDQNKETKIKIQRDKDTPAETQIDIQINTQTAGHTDRRTQNIRKDDANTIHIPHLR